MKKVILKIEGMSCSACQNRVEKYLNKQEGVNANVNLIMASALINYDETKVSIKDLERYINESGYKSLGIYNEKKENKKDNSKIYLIIFGILLIIFMYVSMSHMLDLPIIDYLNPMINSINYGLFLLIISVLFIIYSLDILKSGIKKLFKSPNMDSLVSIGIISSFIYSLINLIRVFYGNNNLIHELYFESVVMVIYFVKLGRYISNVSKEKTKDAIKELVTITPKSAFIKDGETEKEITIDEVKKGDILICKPGMKVSVDGTIVSGSAHFDESFITGESIPVKKKENDNVIAGSLNLDGVILYEAKRIGWDSTISEIVKLVIESINTKTKINKLVDKISSYFVPFVFIISVISFVLNYIVLKDFNVSITSFVTVLVVSCPCSIGLAFPLCLVISNGICAKKGILIKNNDILEIAKNVDTVVFDKTGTLTFGHLSISKIYNYSEYTNSELLNIVASLERNSMHPIKRAFEKYYKSNIEVKDYNEISGIGIEGYISKDKYYIGSKKLLIKLHLLDKYSKDEEKLIIDGNTIMYVIKNKRIIALIGVKDVIKPSALKVVNELKKLNKEVIILSGDNEGSVSLIAKELNINNYKYNVLPVEKEKYVKELKKSGKIVLMIGDGINDAVALTNADIGVSLYTGTDIAENSSDVILMSDDLTKIIDLFKVSKNTMKIIKENLIWAFAYNTIMILVATGLFRVFNIKITPMIASIFMTISSLTVVLNSLRLKKLK